MIIDQRFSNFFEEDIIFLKPEQFHGPPYSYSLRKKIDQFRSIF